MTRRKPDRRRLTTEDVEGFMTAASKQEREPAVNRKLAMADALFKANPWRWWRLKGDAQWARKTLRKAGFNPEEIRWLL